MSGAKRRPGEHAREGDLGIAPAWERDVKRLRAQGPRGLLFLCVANSARSQLAEGIARALAPASVKIFSAGSVPTQVRPEAVAVLEEIGIDAGGQRSKSIDEVPAAKIDAVITLCAEEACPVYLARALCLHWPLPDPAGEPAGEARGLDAYRRVREILRQRLVLLFAP